MAVTPIGFYSCDFYYGFDYTVTKTTTPLLLVSNEALIEFSFMLTSEPASWFTGDVFIQPTQDERNPVVYAVFSTAG